MARRLDELSAAQVAMGRRHAEWRAELEDLIADMIVPIVPLLAVASTGVVAPEEEWRAPPSWQAQADQLGFRASIASPPQSRTAMVWGPFEDRLRVLGFGPV